MNQNTLHAITEELANIHIYTLRLADKYKINLQFAVKEKIEKNSLRYTFEKSKVNVIMQEFVNGYRFAIAVLRYFCNSGSTQ